MHSPDKSPLTARCDSSGSDEMIERNSPSPTTMLSSQLGGAEPYNHHYADPLDLKRELFELERIEGAKKKRNLVYEATEVNHNKIDNSKLKTNGYVPPLPPPRRTSGSSSDMNDHEAFISRSQKKARRKSCLFMSLVIAVFVVSLGAVTLAVISFMAKDSGRNQSDMPENSKLFRLLFVWIFFL